MTRGYLITGGMVYDGTGEPALRADVRIKGSTITAIAPNLCPDGEERRGVYAEAVRGKDLAA